VPIVTALFFGLKAAVLAIVIEAVVRIGKRALKSRSLMALAVAAFVAIFFFAVPFPVIIFAAVLLGLTGVVHPIPLSHRPVEGASSPVQQSLIDEATPEHAKATIGRTARVAAVWLALWLTPVIGFLILFGPQDVFSQIAVFFSKMAMVTFGGAYAVLACVAQQAVQHYGWLTSPLLAGTMGGLLATWVTFTACFLWIFVGAPFIERLRNVVKLNAALSAELGNNSLSIVDLKGQKVLHRITGHKASPTSLAWI
jgi:chromate transporter